MVVSLDREHVITIYRLATVCVLHLLLFDNQSGRTNLDRYALKA